MMLLKERIAHLDLIAREAIDALEAAGTAAPAVAKLRGQLQLLDGIPGTASIPAVEELTERDLKAAELYQQGYSLLEVGRRCGILSPTTVRKTLVRQGLKIRPRGKGHPPAGTGVDRERVEKIKQYLELGENMSDIGNRLGITRERVRQICVKHGISTEHRLSPEQKEWARKYVEGEGSLDFLAKQAGVGSWALKKWVLRAGYKVRPKARSTSLEVQRRSALAAELYGQGMRVADIAKQVGASHPEMVYRYLNLAGVKRDRRGRGVARTWTPEKKAQLEKLYHAGTSFGKIGKELGVSRNAVSGQLHRMGLNHGTAREAETQEA